MTTLQDAFKPATLARLRKVEGLRAQGLTWKEISAQLGVNLSVLKGQFYKKLSLEAAATTPSSEPGVKPVPPHVRRACPYGVRRGGVMTAKCDGRVTRCVCLRASGSEALTRQPREAGSGLAAPAHEPGSGLSLSDRADAFGDAVEAGSVSGPAALHMYRAQGCVSQPATLKETAFACGWVHAPQGADPASASCATGAYGRPKP